MLNALSMDQWLEYTRTGVLRLGRIASKEEMARLSERINAIMLNQVPAERFLMQLDAGGEYANMLEHTLGSKGARLDYRKIEELEHDDLFLSLMQKPLFKDICAKHYGAHASVSVFRAMFMNKPARKGTLLPWHQDGGAIWGLDRDPLATLWTALDPATKANGCVQIVPGSHHLGLLSEYGHTISKEQIAQYCSEEKTQYVELEPGEAVLLHNWVLHRSDVNKTDIPRRAFSVCYMDARTVQTKSGKRFPVVFGKGALEPKALEPAHAG